LPERCGLHAECDNRPECQLPQHQRREPHLFVHDRSEPGYGADEWTARLQERFGEVFETRVRVFPVATGTAANALSLAAASPSWGLVYCSEAAHINTSEANAAGFFGGGLKLVPVGGNHGRIDPDAFARTLASVMSGQLHRGQPAAVNLTQASDLGTVYPLDDIRAIADAAKRRGLKIHMDGARFANALARLRCSPAEISWRAGVGFTDYDFRLRIRRAARRVVKRGLVCAARLPDADRWRGESRLLRSQESRSARWTASGRAYNMCPRRDLAGVGRKPASKRSARARNGNNVAITNSVGV